MANFSLTAMLNRCFRYSFSKAGLRSSTMDLGDGTVMHIWVPKVHIKSRPTLILIHGIGANAMWQWNDFVSPLILAAQFKERVEKLVLCCAGVCLEDKDMEEGMLQVKSVDEAVSILLPQTPQKMRELMKISFYKPRKGVPTCFLNDFIREMCSEHLQERKELIQALHKDRKLSNLPKITQPTLLIWGEHDQIFPLELGHRLERHLGDNAKLVMIKNAGHAINVEKPKVLLKHFKYFLIDTFRPMEPGNHSNGCKTD
ncbi:hypothetical protein Gotri_007639 [Gossypium trilobum]|uniref:AB hydrolase-1 domain-containing protein n=1 Tax=Gossypium trilobum TaxID=34281 RepID=A0A7J9EIB8_9ROSI|nr:hypothetical protein [Gossypium trilobum]